MTSASASEELAGFFDDLVRCETRLYNAVGETLRTRHGLVTSQFEFLRYVRDHPGSRVADIATNFAAGIGAISKITDRCEARGWVARLPNPDDKRSSLINLTPSGATLVRAAELTFQERLSELVAPAVPSHQITAAREALSALRHALEQGRVGTPTG